MSYYDQNEIVENIKSYNRYNDRDKVYPEAFDGERNPTYWYSYDHQDGTRVIVQEVKSEKKYNYLVGMFPTSSDICNSADVLFIRGKNYIHFNLRQKKLDTVYNGSVFTIKKGDENGNVEDVYSSETELCVFRGANDIKDLLTKDLRMNYNRYLPGDTYDLHRAIDRFKEMKRNEESTKKIEESTKKINVFFESNTR